MLSSYLGLRAENLRVIPQNLLIGRFLATLRDESPEARELNQSVLILIFGHGDHETHGITIGGNYAANTVPLLTMRKFCEAIGRNGKTSLLITSYYKGGWVISGT